jgi:uncharacterized tellurite resistance protein B-like protein
MARMPLLIIFFVALFLAILLYKILHRIPRLPNALGDWGSSGASDPRVAVAAMLCAVASEDGPLRAQEERHILQLLESRIGLPPEMARLCLTGGRRLASGLRGDLNARLHQLIGPIKRQCNTQERQDVVDMLHLIAGKNAERLGSVREGLGRVSSSLLVS